MNSNRSTKLAWIIIIGFSIFTFLAVIAGLGKILNLLLPVASLGIGIYFYRRYPIIYIGFTWWLFFLTPFVRRLADYYGSFTDPSPMLLTPFLVALVSLITFYRHLPKSIKHGCLPILLSLIGVIYGYLIALINISPVTATIALLNWLAPLIFAFHLVIHWPYYPILKQNMQRIFLWGTLITGGYGVYQYIVAPEWDCYWLTETGLFTSMGSPEPMGIRVWSTMNSPLPFATVMLAGLIMLFTTEGFLRLPAAALGYLSILLTLVRTAWLGWFVSFISLILSLKAQLQIRLIITIMVMLILVVPLAFVPPFASIIQERVSSLFNVKNDQSLDDRQQLYETVFNDALKQVVGGGIGSNGPGFDSGILDLLLSLGWMGCLPYLSGILLIFLNLYIGTESRFDPFVAASRAIITGIFPMLAGASIMVALPGMVLWAFGAMGLAARLYYKSLK